MTRLITNYAALLLAALAGCASRLPPLPTFPLEDADVTITSIRARTAAASQLTGQGPLTLESSAGRSVQLDSAFVLAPPSRARVRAWKFNQAVFDLTLTVDGAWLYAPRADASQDTTHLGDGIRQWLNYLRVGVPDDATVSRSSDHQLVLVNTDAVTRGTLTTTIDRPTRTVTSYRLTDRTGVERFTLLLDRYRQFGDTLWPTRIVAKSPTGTITLETRVLQPGVAAPTAFTPPARAKRLP